MKQLLAIALAQVMVIPVVNTPPPAGGSSPVVSVIGTPQYAPATTVGPNNSITVTYATIATSTLVVASCSIYNAASNLATSCAITDSNSNSWSTLCPTTTNIPSGGGGIPQVAIWCSTGGTYTNGMTFTATCSAGACGSSGYVAISVIAVKGNTASGYIRSFTGQQITGTTSPTGGSITTNTNDVVVTYLATDDGTSITNPGGSYVGFSGSPQNLTSGHCIGGGAAYLTSPSGAQNPSWTVSSIGDHNSVMNISIK